MHANDDNSEVWWQEVESFLFSSSRSVMEFLMEVITRKQILPMAVPFCYDYSHAIFRFTV